MAVSFLTVRSETHKYLVRTVSFLQQIQEFKDIDRGI